MHYYFLKKSLMAGICIASIAALVGCSTSDLKELVANGNAMSSSSTALKPTVPNKVKIYDTHPKHYKVAGRISADVYNMLGMEHSQESIMAELQKQAASLGANGVINVNQGLAQTTAEAIIVKSR